MFYQLNENLLLRGWQLLPYGVVDRRSGRTEFVSKEIMDVLDLANGAIDFSLPLISDRQRELAQLLEKAGLLHAGETISRISDRQKYLRHDNRYIRTAHWSVTGRCNYKCRHCYMSACEDKYGELSHDDCMEIIRQLAECGIHTVSLTGGEPLLRRDFLELVDTLIANDIVITTIYSNGRLVNERLLQALDRRGLHPEFNMSFDGTEGWHDWLRGVTGATESLERAMKLCRDYGFPTGAEMCLHEQNKHTLRDSVNLLAGLGCQTLKTNPIADVGAWHDGGYGASIGMDDLLELYLDYIPQYYADGRPLSLQLGGFFAADPASEDYTIPSLHSEMNVDSYCVCGHARQVMYISAEGRALPCMALSGMELQKRYPLILEHGLKYCLTESAYMELITTKARTVLEHNERCRTCEYASRCCGGCRASALETSPTDILALDEAACRIVRGGYAERIDAAVHSVAPDAKRH